MAFVEKKTKLFKKTHVLIWLQEPYGMTIDREPHKKKKKDRWVDISSKRFLIAHKL